MKHLFIAVVALLALAACKKKSPAPSMLVNTWTIQGITHTAGSSVKYEVYGRPLITFLAAGMWAETPTIAFSFNTQPQKSGVYRIVENPASTNEMAVFSREGLSPGYYSTGSDVATAFVSLSNGKVQVAASNVRMKSDAFTGADSTTISFNLREF